MSDNLQNELILGLQRSHDEMKERMVSANEYATTLQDAIVRCTERMALIEERMEHVAEELLDDIFLADEIIAEEIAEETPKEPATEDKKEPIEGHGADAVEPEPAIEPQKRVRHFV